MADEGWRDYSPGDSVTLLKGHRYDLLYRPESLGALLQADPETVRWVVGGRPDVAVIGTPDANIIGHDIEVRVQVDSTNPLPTLIPVKLQVVPNDDWFPNFVAAIGNLAGIEGVAELAKIRHLGPSQTSFQEAEDAENRADAELDAPNARNTLAGAIDRIRSGGRAVTLLALGAGGLALWMAASD